MFHHLAPIYFRTGSRIDYTDRDRRKLSHEMPVFSDAQILAADYTVAEPVADSVETQALADRVAYWAPQVAAGEVSAEWAAAEAAGFVSYLSPEASDLDTLARLAFVMLEAA